MVRDGFGFNVERVIRLSATLRQTRKGSDEHFTTSTPVVNGGSQFCLSRMDLNSDLLRQSPRCPERMRWLGSIFPRAREYQQEISLMCPQTGCLLIMRCEMRCYWRPRAEVVVVIRVISFIRCGFILSY